MASLSAAFSHALFLFLICIACFCSAHKSAFAHVGSPPSLSLLFSLKSYCLANLACFSHEFYCNLGSGGREVAFGGAGRAAAAVGFAQSNRFTGPAAHRELPALCSLHLLRGAERPLPAFPLLLRHQLQHTQQALRILLLHPKDMQLLWVPSLVLFFFFFFSHIINCFLFPFA